VALVAAAEIAAIEAVAAGAAGADEAYEQEEEEEEYEYEEDENGSSNSSNIVDQQQQLMPWEVEETEEDEAADGQVLAEVYSDGQDQDSYGMSNNGLYFPPDGSWVQGDDEGEDEYVDDSEAEGEEEPAGEEAACVPYMLWLCPSQAAAEQAAAQHSSVLAAAGVKAVTLDATLVQQLVVENELGNVLQDKQEELQQAVDKAAEAVQEAEDKCQRLQQQRQQVDKLLQAELAAKATYAEEEAEDAEDATAAAAAGAATAAKKAEAAAAEEEEAEGEAEREAEEDEAAAAESEEQEEEEEEGPAMSWCKSILLLYGGPWAAYVPEDEAEALYNSLGSGIRNAEAMLQAKLEEAALESRAVLVALVAAETAAAAAKQEQQQEQECLQQLDAVQLRLGELHAALEQQLAGAHVVFAQAGLLADAEDSSGGILDLSSVRWLIADKGRKEDLAAAAAAAAESPDVEEPAEESDSEGEEGREPAYKEWPLHKALVQLAELLPGGVQDDSGRQLFMPWELQDTSQAARLVYLTQVRTQQCGHGFCAASLPLYYVMHSIVMHASQPSWL
jgi:hypothetical protein